MNSKEGESEILLHHIDKDGTVSTPFIVSETENSRSSGFPRMVVKDDSIYLTWTSAEETLQVNSAEILVSALTEQ